MLRPNLGFQVIRPETTTSESINLIAPSSRTHFSRMSCSAGALGEVGREVPFGNIGSARRTYWTARIIARMPARIALDSLYQASTTAAKSGANGVACTASAPHSAPLWPIPLRFTAFCEWVRIPPHPLFLNERCRFSFLRSCPSQFWVFRTMTRTA